MITDFLIHSRVGKYQCVRRSMTTSYFLFCCRSKGSIVTSSR